MILSVVAFSGLFLGCNNSAPVLPRDGAGLVLSAPHPKDGGVTPSFTLYGFFKYRITSGVEVVSGSIDLSAFQTFGDTVSIPLPHNGKWLISAEWILNTGTTNFPAYIGADEVDVQGATAFSLEMGKLDPACYKVSLADNSSVTILSTDGFNFDTYQSGPATTFAADIQCFLDPAPSLYFAAPSTPTSIFAYLGTGDWVNYTAVPSGTTFHLDTLAAKRAALGPLAVMEDFDVYAVKLSASRTVWLQVGLVNNISPLTQVDLYFRENHHGFPYMKFDVTNYGDTNCDASGVTLY